MTEKQIIIAAVVSNIVALILLLLSRKKKNIARLLFSILFIWAAWANWRMAHNNPVDYLDYSKYAIGPYRTFINGIFTAHIVSIVSFIATGQLLIGLGLLGRGLLVKFSCIGGIIFLLAIAPLGVGSAFPFSIIASIALYILYRHEFKEDILRNKWLV